MAIKNINAEKVEFSNLPLEANVDFLIGILGGEPSRFEISSIEITESQISDFGAYVKITDIDTFVELDSIVADANLVKEGDNVSVFVNDGVYMTEAVYDPAGIAQQLVGISASQTVSNKTLTNTTSIGFDTTYSPTGNEPQGTIYWNEDDQTVDIVSGGVTYQVGQEIAPLVRNNSGATITNGTPVMFSGTIGASGRVTVTPAIADGSIKSSYILGVTTEDILNNEDGHVTHFGKVRQIDTTGTPYGEVWNDGDLIYVSDTTAGHLTNVKPNSPSSQIFVAVVVFASATVGELFVRPSWRGDLTDLADVNGTPLTTNGQILVWDNDNGYFDFTSNINDYFLTSDTKSFKETVSTGIVSGGELSINGVDNTKFDVSAGVGYIVDITTYPATVTEVTWGAFTSQTLTNLATSFATDIAIDINGNIVQQNSFSDVERRNLIFLGGFDHSNQINILSTFSIQVPIASPANSIQELARAVGDINLFGNVYNENGVNLSIDKSGGTVFSYGRNTLNDKTDPHKITTGAQTVVSFGYVFNDGAGNGTFTTPVTSIDPDNYDDGTGVLASVPVNNWTIQRFLFFPNDNKTFVQYGTASYNKKEEALNAVPRAVFEPLSGIRTAMVRGYLIVRQGETDLSSLDTVFLSADRFGIVAGIDGGGSLVSWGNITGTLSDQLDLQAELDGKSDVGHTHVIANITDFTDNSTNWNNAFSWGDHALAGYLTTISGLSHTLLSDIGINTHAQIDAHIADTSVHFTQASISITESQISDLGSYLVSPLTTKGDLLTYSTAEARLGVGTNGQVLTADSTQPSGLRWDTPSSGVTDHTLLTNIGTNTHAQIDSHIADSSIHFTQASISITESQISDLGVYDNYSSWNLKTNNIQRTTVISGGDLDIVAGTDITVNYSAGGVVTINNSFTETSHADVVVDGDFTSEGLMRRGATPGTYSIITDNSADWNTAFGWGDHSLAGYIDGSGAANQIAIFSDADTLTSSANLSLSSTLFTLNVGGAGNGVISMSNAGVTTITSATSLELRTDLFTWKDGTGTSTYLDRASGIVRIHGQAALRDYGVGTYTGTEAKLLAVQSNGNIIEKNLTDYLTPTGDGSGLTNIDADTLDTLDSTQFLRSDVADVKNGDLTLNTGNLIVGTTTLFSNSNITIGGYATHALAPTTGNHLTNKTYVDGQVSGAISDWLRADVADIKTSGNLTFNDNVEIQFGTAGAESRLLSNGNDMYWDMYAADLRIRDNVTTAFTFITATGNFINTGTITSQGTGDSSFAGNVGIGLTAPSEKLHISNGNGTTFSEQGTIAFCGDVPSRYTSISGYRYSSSLQAGLLFRTLSSTPVDAMVLNNVGDLGIGTLSPQVAIDLERTKNNAIIRTTSTTDDSLWSDGDIYGSFEMYSQDGSNGGAGLVGYLRAVNSTTATGNRSDLVFGNRDATNLISEKMRLDYLGNLGIGTSTPQRNVDIAASNPILRLTSTKNGTWTVGEELAALEFYGSDASGAGAAVQGKINLVARATFGDDFDMAFHVDDAAGTLVERMRILATGEVGIGTTPSELLHVSGGKYLQRVATNATGSWQLNNAGNTARVRIDLDGDDSSLYLRNSTNTYSIRLDSLGTTYFNGGNVAIGKTSASTALDVTGAGTFSSTVTATNFILSSDKRLKTNIKSISADDYVDVSWKTFKFKNNKQNRYGVVAQELEKKHPEFVRTDDEGMKSVAYIDLLIAKIAELEARLEKAGL